MLDAVCLFLVPYFIQRRSTSKKPSGPESRWLPRRSIVNQLPHFCLLFLLLLLLFNQLPANKRLICSFLINLSSAEATNLPKASNVASDKIRTPRSSTGRAGPHTNPSLQAFGGPCPLEMPSLVNKFEGLLTVGGSRDRGTLIAT